MASIVDVERLFGRGFDVTIDPSSKVTRNYKRKLRLRVDENLDPDQVANLYGVEQFYTHPRDPFAFLRKLSCTDVPDKIDPWVYELNLEYSTDQPDLQEQPPKEPGESDDPLLDPMEIEWQSEETQTIKFRDRDNRPFLNTAGDVIESPPPIPDSTLKLVVTRNEAYYDPARARFFGNTINQHAFYGCEPGQLRLHPFGSKQSRRNGRIYWPHTYIMEFKQDGWQPKQISAGYRELVDGQLTRIKDPETRNDVSEPIPLDADGRAIPAEDLKANPDLAVYIEFTGFRETDFAQLGLNL
ncbi:hypothetical protein Plim_4264 (plasmid) [Planctopirus limnophila DSM 3776]|uniref:Uncharacterized protein n=1 Tax=Planctopirus limnophila (strain ATCC 43296 / DSM 3776 / IFAM 1008 / Mu 290) TaxID=521674 RepID=D5SZF1_PLAL2|nr:hypothetical protein [Planctopirus limnophila]ADG70071.1 hypothetical protein Plim_4264 [Planctopirus limnophila DSM 3776]